MVNLSHFENIESTIKKVCITLLALTNYNTIASLYFLGLKKKLDSSLDSFTCKLAGFLSPLIYLAVKLLLNNSEILMPAKKYFLDNIEKCTDIDCPRF